MISRFKEIITPENGCQNVEKQALRCNQAYGD